MYGVGPPGVGVVNLVVVADLDWLLGAVDVHLVAGNVVDAAAADLIIFLGVYRPMWTPPAWTIAASVV